jgi:hypothetical protein
MKLSMRRSLMETVASSNDILVTDLDATMNSEHRRFHTIAVKQNACLKLLAI